MSCLWGPGLGSAPAIETAHLMAEMHQECMKENAGSRRARISCDGADESSCWSSAAINTLPTADQPALYFRCFHGDEVALSFAKLPLSSLQLPSYVLTGSNISY